MTRNPRTLKKAIAYLVSMLLLTGLLVVAGAANPIVSFPDHGLEAAVRGKLERPKGLLYQNDLQNITQLDAVGFGIENLEGLERMHRLVELNLSLNAVTSVEPLATLTFLKDLDLSQNGIKDLHGAGFSSFSSHGLRSLTLSENEGIKGWEALEGLTELESLVLRRSGIEALGSMPDFPVLTELDLRENGLKDLSSLPSLPSLEKLNLRENTLLSVEELRRFPSLTYLNLHSNEKIEVLEPLSALTQMETLILEGVPLEGQERILEGLDGLQRVNLQHTGFQDYSVLRTLRSLGALSGEVQPPSLRYDLAPPTFLAQGGFHESSFLLTLESMEEGAVIRYTLDGTLPREDSPLYEEGIFIEPKTGEAPLSQISTAQRWQEPRGPVSQGTVVRARVFDGEGGQSAAVTQSFFVHKEGADRHRLPVISLVTEPAHFFDSQTGIYQENNAKARGAEWERPVHVEFYETDGTLAFSQEAGARIQGDTSTAFSQKSLRLYARGDYDEASYFAHEIFPGLTTAEGAPKDQFKRLVLRNSGNDWNSTMMRDALMHRLAGKLESMDTQAYRPAVVYLNGEYWGIHNLRERYEQHYLATTYGVAVGDVALLESSGKVEVGTAGDGADYQALLRYVERYGVTAPEHYAAVEAQMDVDNFLDYIVAETYFANYDWPNNNIRWWRVSSPEYYPEGPKEADGRWRWMLYDTDLGFSRYPTYQDRHGGYGSVEHDTIHWVLTELDGRWGTRTWPNLLTRAFLENEDFRARFLLRHADLLNSHFLPEVVEQEVHMLQEGIAEEMLEHLRRWNLFNGSVSRWETNVELLVRFGEERPDILRGHLMEAFDLSGLAEIHILPSTGGTVKVNTLLLSEGLPHWEEGVPWRGTYFQGVALPITAIPDPGFAFLGWEGSEEEDSNITPVLGEDLTLRPVFQPLP